MFVPVIVSVNSEFYDVANSTLGWLHVLLNSVRVTLTTHIEEEKCLGILILSQKNQTYLL